MNISFLQKKWIAQLHVYAEHQTNAAKKTTIESNISHTEESMVD